MLRVRLLRASRDYLCDAIEALQTAFCHDNMPAVLSKPQFQQTPNTSLRLLSLLLHIHFSRLPRPQRPIHTHVQPRCHTCTSFELYKTAHGYAEVVLG